MATKKNTEPTIDTPEDIESSYMYVGSTIKGVISHALIIPGTYAEALEAQKSAIDKYSEIASLIVPASQIATARASIKSGKGALALINKRLIDKVSGNDKH